MLAHKHEVLCLVTKPWNDHVLFEEKEMPFRAFRLWKTKISSVYFIFCACEYLQHLELDKSFFLSTGIAYIYFEVFAIHYEVFCRLLSIAFVLPKTTLLR